MDTVVRQLMTEFCEHRRLTDLTEPERFEVFAAHCVLHEHVIGSVEAVDFRIGGSADGGIDGYAVALNGRLFRSGDGTEPGYRSRCDHCGGASQNVGQNGP